MMHYRGRSNLISGGITIASFVAGALTFLIPVARGVDSPLKAHWHTALAMVAAALFTGAAIWFLRSVRTFKSSLRSAYRLLAMGLMLLSAALLQLPIVGLFDMWNSIWVTSGGVILPFVLAFVLMYLGLRRFAILLQIHTKVILFKRLTVIALVFMVFSGVAAHYGVRYSLEGGVDIYIATVGWALCYMIAGVLLARQITRAIGAEYQHAMHWLTIALIGIAIDGFLEYSVTFFVPSWNPYVTYGLYLINYIAAGLLVVQASRAFYQLAVEGANNVVAAALNQPLRDQDYIDSITTIASLASRPQEIDPLLDDVRMITATLEPGSPLPATDKQRLVNVYVRLEKYLIASDPLRNFSKEDLRERVTPAFRSVLENGAITTNVVQNPTPQMA